MQRERVPKTRWLLLAALIAFMGCKADVRQAPAQGPSSPSTGKAAKTISANLTGYNHTHKTIGAFYVNGVWGGNVTPHAGGGKFVCCAELPAPWSEGISVKVSWEDHLGYTHSKDVLVPRYDDATLSRLSVHFLRSGEVKVFANRLSLWHPDYPLQGKEAELHLRVPIGMLPLTS
jgi:hypothetical protein